MSELIVKVVMSLAVVAALVYPIAKARRTGGAYHEVLEPSEELEAPFRRKEAAYSALRELEFDYRVGALSEPDYRELEAKYKLEAVAAIEEVEQLETAAQDAAVAGQKKVSRGRRSAKPKVKKGVQRGGPRTLCTSCGTELSPSGKFCGLCGTKAVR